MLLYLGYGVVGGIGLGLGYVTPVATVAKWFPDQKGLATGMVIMGFGFGALLMSKVAYGAILTAWSAGGIVGPQMIALLKDDFPGDPAKAATLAFWLSAAVLGIGLVLAILWRGEKNNGMVQS